jgi:hypothetical protein
MEFLPSLEAFLDPVLILFATVGTLVVLNGVRIFIRYRWFAKKDYFGDKITGTWVNVVSEGERSLTHSLYHWRCNCCGQKNMGLLQCENTFGAMPAPTSNPDGSKDYLCGACGCKYNAPGLGEVKRSRGCTDPIPELRRPATHASVSMLQAHDLKESGKENRINICKTCDGSKIVSVPSSVNTGELWGEWEEAPCPDCYVANDDSAPPAMSARRRAIEHTRAKVSAEEADRLKEPREDIISPM